MRRSILVASLFSSYTLATAFSPLDLFRGNPSSLSQAQPLHPAHHQSPMNPGPIQGGAEPGKPTGDGNFDDSTLSISDILPQTRKINIFASLTRDISTVTSRLDSTKPEDNTTLLAPLNSAMQALPRKPWEDRPGDEGVSAQYNEDKAAQNLQRFVEEHVVPLEPLEGREENRIKTMGGQELWWEENGDGDRVIKPGNLVVDGVVGRVGNGEIWAVKGVVNYA